MDFLTSVSGSVVAAIMVAVLGISGITVRVISGPSKQSSKLGDRLIGTAWVMLIVGAFLFGSNNGQFTNIGKNDIWALLGMDLMGLSVLAWVLGKLARLFFR